MFWTRLLSGIALVLACIGVLYCGGIVTNLALLVLSLKGIQELLKVYNLHRSPLGIVSYISTIIYYLVLYFDFKFGEMPIIVVYILIMLAFYVFTYPRYRDVEIAKAILAFLYVGVMLAFVYQIRVMEHGGFLVILIFICSWGNDTFAYCAGVTMGKHKMTPKLSPKKSIEGAIGGIVGAGVLGAIFGVVYSNIIGGIDYAPIVFAVVAALGAFPAIIGDLAASAIKRNNDIKDYSDLIPGHGGVLDRFDSIIFTAPIIYYMLKLYMKYMA